MEPTETEGRHDAEESFEAIVRRLQQIVEKLEAGELPLEASLKAFEQGVELSRKGQAILDVAERRVEVLLENGSTEPLAGEER